MPPPTNPHIEVIRLTPPMLLTPETKKIFADAALGGAWTSRTPQRLRRTGVNPKSQRKFVNDIGIIDASFTALIGITGTAPPCVINLRQEVDNIWKSTPPDLVRQSQKFDAAVDGKFSNNPDSMTIFMKILGEKISNSSIQDLYTICRMNLTADPVQTLTKPQFIDLGIFTIGALDKGSGLSTPAIII